jgi:pimeloyl-ACP methyl ester carboxylesterase
MSAARRWQVLAVTAVALLATGCSLGPGSRTTTPPHPGELLTAQPVTSAAALPSASSTRLITYVSEDPHRRPTVVSGTLAVPKSPPPTNGWPVISWAHGTTGYAGICAPSADFDDGPAHDYLGLVDQTLDTWVARGYAVVQTDYQGLGTPGGAPYSNGASAAHNVTDMVRAARELDSSIGTTWVAIGHSQGGQAALFAAADAQRGAPEIELAGAVAIAAGSGFAQSVEFATSDSPGAEAAQPFLPLLVLGAAVADPGIDPAEIFTPQFQPFVTAARTGCLGQLRGLAPIPPSQVFAPDADLTALTDYLARQEPGTRTPQVPVLIAQGLADTTVQPALADALATTYCDQHLEVSYRTYPGVDHRGAVAASLSDAQQFVSAVLSGQPTPDTCNR